MSRSGILAIDAGTLYTPHEKIPAARLIIEDGIIREVGAADRIALPANAQRIDATNQIVTPGFIEPHVHGYGGVDVMDGSFDALNTMSRGLAQHGTTSFLATTVSSTPDILSGAVENIGNLISRNFDGARPLGIHLEGPFINPAKRGTHTPGNISAPDPEQLRRWVASSKSNIRLLTIAPEVDGNNEIVSLAATMGIRVAMGHSNATFEQASAAATSGVCYAVHTFNAMREFSHREPGIVGAVLSDDRIFAEIIADGIHVHPSVVRFFARAKRAERILIVTDGTSATGMTDGEYLLGRERVVVTHGVCRDAEGRLAGSTLTQDRALKNFVEWTGFSLQDALLGLTENPACALGIKGKGALVVGADADIVVLDSDLSVLKTFVAGKEIPF